MQPIGPPLPNNQSAWFDRWMLSEISDRILITSKSIQKRKLNPYLLVAVVAVASVAAILGWELASPEMNVIRVLIAAVPAVILVLVGLSLVNRVGASTDPSRGTWELDGVGYEVRRNGLSIALFENVTRILIAAPSGGTESYIVLLFSDGTQLGLAGRGDEEGKPELAVARKLAKFIGCPLERH